MDDRERALEALARVLELIDTTPRDVMPVEPPWSGTRAVIGLESAWVRARLGDGVNARRVFEEHAAVVLSLGPDGVEVARLFATECALDVPPAPTLGISDRYFVGRTVQFVQALAPASYLVPGSLFRGEQVVVERAIRHVGSQAELRDLLADIPVDVYRVPKLLPRADEVRSLLRAAASFGVDGVVDAFEATRRIWPRASDMFSTQGWGFAPLRYFDAVVFALVDAVRPA